VGGGAAHDTPPATCPPEFSELMGNHHRCGIWLERLASLATAVLDFSYREPFFVKCCLTGRLFEMDASCLVME